MAFEVAVIHNGYSKQSEAGFETNCTCTLIKGKYNVIVDTMTPWDADVILKGLEKYNLKQEDIHYVVSTHGHSDHCGCNYLFLNSTHIVGHCISKRNIYYDEPFSTGKPYFIDSDNLKLIPTPGHTLSDITVLVKTKDGLIAIVGDLFEKEEDIQNEYLWLSAGSESPALQRYNRNMIMNIADYIIPGHGGMFKVAKEMRTSFIAQK